MYVRSSLVDAVESNKINIILPTWTLVFSRTLCYYNKWKQY